jgi:hypothetical protein
MRAKRWVIAGVIGCSLLGLGFLGSNRWPGLDQANDTQPSPGSAGAAGDGFPFAADRGGKLLSQLLAPSETEIARKSAIASQPRRFPDLESRRHPEAPLTPLLPDLPRPLALPPARSVQPRSLPDEPPLTRTLFTLALPETPQLPVSPGVRLPSLNPEQPAPAPILAQPRSEHGATDHPTAAFSTATALAAPLPERTRPVPFMRLVLPDPFEHYQAVRLRVPLPDMEVPSAVSRLPGR